MPQDQCVEWWITGVCLDEMGESIGGNVILAGPLSSCSDAEIIRRGLAVRSEYTQVRIWRSV